MTNYIGQALANAFKAIFTSQEEKLGVEKGFPIKVCVGLNPEAYPLTAATSAGDRYLSATYKGNNNWVVRDQSVEPEEMGTAIFDQGPARNMTTQQLLDTFDKAVAEFPAQKFMAYDEAAYDGNARGKIAALGASLAAASAPAAKAAGNEQKLGS